MALVPFCALSLATRTRGFDFSILALGRLLFMAGVKFSFVPVGKSPWWYFSM